MQPVQRQLLTRGALHELLLAPLSRHLEPRRAPRGPTHARAPVPHLTRPAALAVRVRAPLQTRRARIFGANRARAQERGRQEQPLRADKAPSHGSSGTALHADRQGYLLLHEIAWSCWQPLPYHSLALEGSGVPVTWPPSYICAAP